MFPNPLGRHVARAHGESQWTADSPWKNVSPKGQILDAGEIVESDPMRRLAIRWENEVKPELKAEDPSRCIVAVEPFGTSVKLSITHTIERTPSALIEAVAGGWPKVVSNLKSMVETGPAVLTDANPN